MKTIVYPPGLTLYPGLGRHWWERITSEQLAEIARLYDQLGFDLMICGEHAVVRPEMVREFGPRFADPFAAGSFLLGATRRIRMLTMTVLPLRNPVQLAKTISTIDFASGGRIVPMLMVGYLPWEYELAGAPSYEERNEVMDEYVEAMRALWTEDAPRYDGRYVQFENVVFEPKPTQNPMPTWFGGRSRRAIRRAVRYGEGWLMQAGARAQVSRHVDYLRLELEKQERTAIELGIDLYDSERDPVTHEVLRQPTIVLEPEAVLEQMREIAALGATCVRVDDLLGVGKYQNDLPGAPPKTRSFSDYVERVHWFAEEILPEAQKLEGAPLL